MENVPYTAPDGSSDGLWVNTSTYLPDVPALVRPHGHGASRSTPQQTLRCPLLSTVFCFITELVDVIQRTRLAWCAHMYMHVDARQCMQAPEIFTKHVKPFFTYWNPPHAKVTSKPPPPPGTTVRMDVDRYKHVEPNQEYTQAFLRAHLDKAVSGPSQPTKAGRAPTSVVFTPNF